MGLALSTSEHIVKNDGGKIEVDDSAQLARGKREVGDDKARYSDIKFKLAKKRAGRIELFVRRRGALPACIIADVDEARRDHIVC